MITTFKETLASIQDLKYGQVVIKKTVKEVLWYWTKYLLVIAFGSLFLGLAGIVYYTPQLPQLLNQNFVRGDTQFALVVDTKDIPDNIDRYTQGIFILKDKMITKSDGNLETISYDKQAILDYTNNHQNQILVVGILITIFTTLILFSLVWVWKSFTFAVLAGILWLIVKISKRELFFVNAFKIIVYASILPFLVSILAIFSPGWFADLLGTGLLIFYILNWTRNLWTTVKS